MDIKSNMENQAQILIDLTNDLRLPKEFRKFLYEAANNLIKGKLVIEDREKVIAIQMIGLEEQQKLIDSFQHQPPVSRKKTLSDLER